MEERGSERLPPSQLQRESFPVGMNSTSEDQPQPLPPNCLFSREAPGSLVSKEKEIPKSRRDSESDCGSFSKEPKVFARKS